MTPEGSVVVICLLLNCLAGVLLALGTVGLWAAIVGERTPLDDSPGGRWQGFAISALLLVTGFLVVLASKQMGAFVGLGQS